MSWIFWVFWLAMIILIDKKERKTIFNVGQMLYVHSWGTPNPQQVLQLPTKADDSGLNDLLFVSAKTNQIRFVSIEEVDEKNVIRKDGKKFFRRKSNLLPAQNVPNIGIPSVAVIYDLKGGREWKETMAVPTNSAACDTDGIDGIKKEELKLRDGVILLEDEKGDTIKFVKLGWTLLNKSPVPAAGRAKIIGLRKLTDEAMEWAYLPFGQSMSFVFPRFHEDTHAYPTRPILVCGQNCDSYEAILPEKPKASQDQWFYLRRPYLVLSVKESYGKYRGLIFKENTQAAFDTISSMRSLYWLDSGELLAGLPKE